MATRFFNLGEGTRAELARRWELAREPCPEDVRGPRLLLLLNELTWVAEPVKRMFREHRVATARTPRSVMLLPGFGAHPIRMRYMARQLEKAGHTVKRWGMGYNLGATAERFFKVEERLLDLFARRGEPIVLVGWSLGGVIARELAKRHPDKVAKVITMGSPFSGSPRANNGWRAYQAIAGHRVDEPEFEAEPAVKPPVETVALWSPLDGVVNPRSACGWPGERDRAVPVRCSHMGFVYSKDSIDRVLGELEAV
ncbi:alpha/beta fold hydrolase [Qipengyuania sp. MTN3-11]|uniref:alpha/beta fold hydrolase n=1 Tax=Qipengyuania sp. MTN3-11 TaxID=3056557 RepID=UPI0036F3E8F4